MTFIPSDTEGTEQLSHVEKLCKGAQLGPDGGSKFFRSADLEPETLECSRDLVEHSAGSRPLNNRCIIAVVSVVNARRKQLRSVNLAIPERDERGQ